MCFLSPDWAVQKQPTGWGKCDLRAAELSVTRPVCEAQGYIFKKRSQNLERKCLLSTVTLHCSSSILYKF